MNNRLGVLEGAYMAKQAGVVLGLASGLVVAVAALGQQPLASKKLIEYGWDVPNPAYIRANIREMEKRPFDGLIFRLPGGTNVLSKAKWDEARTELDKALAIFEETGEKEEISKTFYELGNYWRDRGDAAKAREGYERAVAGFASIGSKKCESMAREALGKLA